MLGPRPLLTECDLCLFRAKESQGRTTTRNPLAPSAPVPPPFALADERHKISAVHLYRQTTRWTGNSRSRVARRAPERDFQLVSGATVATDDLYLDDKLHADHPDVIPP